jgi:hypothetical protein
MTVRNDIATAPHQSIARDAPPRVLVLTEQIYDFWVGTVMRSPFGPKPSRGGIIIG